ncbi:phage terminase small subunit P27 family [Clostridium cagae]|uniref:Phage terminase small subunit P27 family n=1 Tax=Clostridium botulinum TaxID=1491 RepID=A0A6B4JKN7_CLOBO|nr:MULTISPECIES: phage terminase small subunit P27 family [Clostridium]EES49060.1 putative phage terminase, small subunit, P27 family [Clostridium botulinum E1 str. 'BoNT E Beluga']MBY6760792.1 phage terminase small subunit P27 family [Clostridium botulinum]MBY6919916.1 phage terminase small subunit P27 family [Clostridium botulinum]MCR1130579.1 phage terminase small subunit P27 family [Clostridium botulinum]NFJ57480.1 phage terminase small subunit P27 family [Clostridium botulinum]
MKKAPTSLNEIGIKEWKRMYKLIQKECKDFTDKDLALLEVYCKNYEKWIKSEKFLDDNGYSYICSTGYPSQYPEVTISNNAQKQMISAMRELGLSPASRSKIMKQVSSTSDDTDDEMEEMVSK